MPDKVKERPGICKEAEFGLLVARRATRADTDNPAAILIQTIDEIRSNAREGD